MTLKKQNNDTALKAFVFRLKPHQDLKKEILAFAKGHHIQAGFILTCVGSVEQLHLRFANQKTGQFKTGYYEITSLCGTFSKAAAHLHLTVADTKGKTLGGHLLEETLIYTTAEIVVGSLVNLKFERAKDNTYGFLELAVKTKKPSRP